MKYELLDYQREAAIGCLKRLKQARDGWVEEKDLSSFALSAVTASGKTVIATSVIEAMTYGSADLGVEADPRALFLWVTDDPALNRQTRKKMIDASDLLELSRLVDLNDSFLDAELRPGRVYFLNIQQLAKSAGFAKGGTNLRQYGGWDILGNTIRATDRDLYLVLDEAHRGMKQMAQRPTIVQRIIAGQSGSNPAVPVVWGISATIERFTAAMKSHESRTMYAPIAVDTAKVQASGIIKDQIQLDRPDEKGKFDQTLLRGAVSAAKEFEQRWFDYHVAEQEPLVLPVLVVQVADKPSDAHLAEIVSVIENQWRDLHEHAVINVFGEHSDLVVGARKVRYVNPETIQDHDGIRVVLAKSAISTGWDCPRAEVLFSERPASDATHIAQVIGRMVRSPLARRITTDDALNSVACYLPRFDENAVTAVIEALTKPGEPGEVAEIVTHARVFERNPNLPAEVFEFVEALPSWPKPDKLADPLRRAKALVKLLTDDSTGTAMMADAGAKLTATLNAKLDGLAAEHSHAVAANVSNLETAEIEQKSVMTSTGEKLGTAKLTIDTALGDLDRQTRKVIGSVREGVARGHLAYRVDKAGDMADELSIRTEVAALIMVDGVVDTVNDTATTWVKDRLARFDADFKLTTGPTKAAWMRVKEMASEQEPTGIELPTTIKTGTKDGNDPGAPDLPTFVGHVFASTDDSYPVKVNAWEQQVLLTEIARPSFVAWYRNPSRAAPAALRIGYLDANDAWQSLQPDFIVVQRRSNGKLAASIVDPHGDHLADAVPKLHALAGYAERFGDRFTRILAIARPDGELRSLDVCDPTVRATVLEHAGPTATALYEDTSLSQPYR